MNGSAVIKANFKTQAVQDDREENGGAKSENAVAHQKKHIGERHIVSERRAIM